MSQITYNVDLVLCIDCTGSMSPIIELVKERALSFHGDLLAEMDSKGKSIDSLRVKIIAFRDYYVDGKAAMSESAFFTLPEQSAACSAFVSALRADGGGDEPENSLEALALALNSDWTKVGDKQRHVTVMWTDASAHPLEKAFPEPPADYPTGLPRSFDDLTDFWEGQVLMAAPKRLILFAPDAYPWSTIADHWANTVAFTSKAGKGLDEVTYKAILDAIANSV